MKGAIILNIENLRQYYRTILVQKERLNILKMNLTAVGKKNYGTGITYIKFQIIHFPVRGLSQKIPIG